MRVLVTGAAGFIGSHVLEAMIGQGHDVIGLDSLAAAVHAVPPEYLPDEVPLVTGDVRDSDAVWRALRGVDAVCHQAAIVGLGVGPEDLPLYADVNGTGTAVLLAAMAKARVGRLVLASSMVVYGEGAYKCPADGPVVPGPRVEADLLAGRFEARCPICKADLAPETVSERAPLDPRNTYAATKVAQEHLAIAWARMTGGSAVALRYHNVYGPRMPRDTPYSGVAALFRSALEGGRAPRVFEDGRQLRDFIHVRDVAEANVRALKAGAEGRLLPYNVATGQPHSIAEMAVVLAREYGGPDPKVTGEYRLGDVRHILASPDHAARELDFRARVGFAEGMGEFARAPLRKQPPPVRELPR